MNEERKIDILLVDVGEFLGKERERTLEQAMVDGQAFADEVGYGTLRALSAAEIRTLRADPGVRGAAVRSFQPECWLVTVAPEGELPAEPESLG